MATMIFRFHKYRHYIEAEIICSVKHYDVLRRYNTKLCMLVVLTRGAKTKNILKGKIFVLTK